MDPRYGTPPVPRFPLFQPPLCKDPNCGAVCRLCLCEERDYYTCDCGKWCTYDDAEGVTPGNPLCDCGFYCRLVFSRDGGTLFTCALGKCEKLQHRDRSRGYSSPARRRPLAALLPSPGASGTSASRPARIAFSETSGNGSRDNEFVRLLDHAVAAASRTSFPTRVVNMYDLTRALPSSEGTESSNPKPEPFRLRSSTEFERHAKVGAAGELFVSDF